MGSAVEDGCGCLVVSVLLVAQVEAVHSVLWLQKLSRKLSDSPGQYGTFRNQCNELQSLQSYCKATIECSRQLVLAQTQGVGALTFRHRVLLHKTPQKARENSQSY